CDRLDVRGGVRNRASRLRVRAAVAGPVVNDRPKTVALVDPLVRVARVAAPRRAVADDERHAVGRAALDVRKRAPVYGSDRSLASHGPDHTVDPLRRTCAFVTLAGEGQPSSFRPPSSSPRNSSSTRRAPSSPPAASPQRIGLPVQTARAPSASAFSTSAPRL